MREFKTAARNATAEREKFEFKLDDHVLVSVRPDESLIVWLMAAYGSETRTEESRVADMIDGAMQLFDTDSQRILKHRLLDQDDPFTFQAGDGDDSVGLMDLIMELIEEWTENPTKPSSGSTSPSEDTGTASTATASRGASSSSRSTQRKRATSSVGG